MKIIWIYRVEVDWGLHITTWRETYKHLHSKNSIYYIFPYEKEKNGFTQDITYVKPIPLPYLKRLTYIILSFLKFVKLNREIKPDLVVLDIWSFFYSSAFFFSRERPKVILDHRTAVYNQYIGKKYAFLNWGLRILTKLALIYNRKFHDGAAYISEGLRHQLQNDLQVKSHPVYHIWPSGVDTETFKPGSVYEN